MSWQDVVLILGLVWAGIVFFGILTWATYAEKFLDDNGSN